VSLVDETDESPTPSVAAEVIEKGRDRGVGLGHAGDARCDALIQIRDAVAGTAPPVATSVTCDSSISPRHRTLHRILSSSELRDYPKLAKREQELLDVSRCSTRWLLI
jgi:hypothetical protein